MARMPPLRLGWDRWHIDPPDIFLAKGVRINTKVALRPPHSWNGAEIPVFR